MYPGEFLSLDHHKWPKMEANPNEALFKYTDDKWIVKKVNHNTYILESKRYRNNYFYCNSIDDRIHLVDYEPMDKIAIQWEF